MRTYQRIEEVKNNIRSKELKKLGRLTPKAFTRERKMTFEDYCMFILNRKGITLKMEIEDYRKNVKKEEISESAICQQRKNLNPEVFKELNRLYVKDIYETEDLKTMKGYLVFAIDGTDLEIPNVAKLKEEFGVAKSRKENRTTAKATASCIYDVLNEVILSSKIARYKTSERLLAKQIIDEIQEHVKNKKVLIIFDRGYPSIGLMYYLDLLNIKYLIRNSSLRYPNEIKNMKTMDENVELKMNSQRLYNIRDKEIKKVLKIARKYEIRIVKYPLEKEEEILFTNLKKEEFNSKEIGELYNKRWGIEIAYDILKNKLNVENFSGENKIIIEQEFYAQILLENIALDIRNEANSKIKAKEYKYEYKINMNILIGRLKREFINLMIEDSEDKVERFEEIIEKIKETLIPIRKNRKNPRKRLSYRSKYRRNKKRNI